MHELPPPHLTAVERPILPVLIWSVVNVVAFLFAGTSLMGICLLLTGHIPTAPRMLTPPATMAVMLPLGVAGIMANLCWIVGGLIGAIRRYTEIPPVIE